MKLGGKLEFHNDLDQLSESEYQMRYADPPAPFGHDEIDVALDDEGDGVYWTTREGLQLLISEMGSRHIINTIKMLRDAAPGVYDVSTLNAQRFHATLHGEAAIDAADAIVDRMMAQDPEEYLEECNSSYRGLCKEADSRGIDLRTLELPKRKLTVQLVGRRLRIRLEKA